MASKFQIAKKKKEESKTGIPKGNKPKPEPEPTQIIRSGQTGDPKLFSQSGKFFGGNKEDLSRKVTQAAQQQANLSKIEPDLTGVSTTLEDEGAFQDVTPKEVSLKEDLKTDIPIIGPSGQALSQSIPEVPTFAQVLIPKLGALELARKKGWLDKVLPDKIKGEEAFPETEETLREAALRQISINSFDKGISRAEKFGSMVEAIPAIGALGRTWVGGLVEAPSGNADEVIAEINIIKEDASTGQEKVRNGLEDPGFGLDQAQQMEEDIASLEGRLALLISTSAILQANSDEVNKIQTNILAAKKKVARYKQASSFGLTAQLTGTGRIVPTDEQIFFELKGG